MEVVVDHLGQMVVLEVRDGIAALVLSPQEAVGLGSALVRHAYCAARNDLRPEQIIDRA